MKMVIGLIELPRSITRIVIGLPKKILIWNFLKKVEKVYIWECFGSVYVKNCFNNCHIILIDVKAFVLDQEK